MSSLDEALEIAQGIGRLSQMVADRDEHIAELEAKVERLEDPDWLTYIELTKQWLAHYPADIFDGSSGAPGPLFVVAIRNALAVLEGE